MASLVLAGALQRLLSALLAAGQCYVLTANMALKRVEEALNAMLAQGGAKGKSVTRFAMNETVRFVPKGDKLRELEEIVATRGFVLVGGNQR